MNSLVDRFGSTGKFTVLGFPCGQFGHQEIGNDSEIRACLKHVRPGDGFEPKFPLMKKGDVNGTDAQAIFKFLRAFIPYPEDRTPELDMVEPYGIMKGSIPALHNPRTPSDIHWNFEKFLIGKDGRPRHRFSPKYPREKLDKIIEEMIREKE